MATISESSPVSISTAGRVLRVALANPPDNRITSAMLERLSEAFDAAESEALDLVLIEGTSRVFSKGFDISALNPEADPAELRRLLVKSNALFSRIARFPKPTVAAISGACLGGGLELALACRMRVCTDRARLGLPEVWIKLVPGLGGVYRLSRLVGPSKAFELVALGNLIDSQEALDLRLVNRVFPRDGFAERVDSFLAALLMADSKVIQELVHLAACAERLDEEDNVREGLESFARLAATWTPPTSS